VHDIARLRRDPALNVTQIAGMRVMYVAMDMERDVSPHIRDANGQPMARNPLKDPRVRQALSYAINREAIVERVMDGAATVASNLLPDGTPGTSSALGVTPFEPERARRLLAEAGYHNGFQATIHATNDRYPNDDRVAQAIAQFWTRVGVRTDVVTMPNAAYFPAAARQSFSIMAAQYGADNVSYAYRALVHTFDRDRGLGTANRTRHSSPRADALVAEALTTMDEAQRNALLARAADVAIGEEAVIHMIYHPAYVYAARKPISETPYYQRRLPAAGCEAGLRWLSEREHLGRDELVVVVGPHRVPVDAVRGDCHLGLQGRWSQHHAVGGPAASGQRTQNLVFDRDAQSVQELAQLLFLGQVGRHQGCGHSDAEPLVQRGAHPGHGARPRALAAVRVVPVGRGRVQADLQRDAAVHLLQPLEPTPVEEHPVGQQRRGQRLCARVDQRGDVRQQERLTPCEQQLAHTGRRRLQCQPLDHVAAQRPPRRARRRPYAAVVAREVAVEVGVHP
jgi:hypothetical protein